jgi:DNA-binding GntR family transcriptional regulator
VTADQLVDVRRAIELAAIDAAARRMNEAGIARLRDIQKATWEAIDGGRFADAERLSQQVHVVIAELAGNPALPLFVRALTRVSTQITKRPVEEPVGLMGAFEAHRQILEALISGDGPVAHYRMDRHLRALRSWLC